MQSATVAEGSLVLTRQGWEPASAAEGDHFIAGVNRFGKIEFAPVELAPKQPAGKVIFFGTSRSCGFFSQHTCVQESSGLTHRIRDIVDAMRVSELRFEQVIGAGHDERAVPNLDRLWHALSHEAALGDNQVLAVRCRDARIVSIDGKPVGTTVKRGARRYLVLKRNELRGLVGERAPHIPLDVIGQALLNEDGDYEFARSNVFLAMEAARALSLTGTSYEFIYDSLQHTSLINLRSVSTTELALGRGACAHFVSSHGRPEVRLSWSTAAWSPICNGLILAASRKINEPAAK